MDYKPYSPEWHRKRYLKEALDKYLDDYIENDIIMNDILSIICERQDRAHAEISQTRRSRIKTAGLICYLLSTDSDWNSSVRRSQTTKK